MPTPTSSTATGRLAPGLRVLSHNVDGLNNATKIHALVSLWAHLKAHIICVQETHLGSLKVISRAQQFLNEATQQLGLPLSCFFGVAGRTRRISLGLAFLCGPTWCNLGV